MLNIFPLQFLALLAYFILRLFAGSAVLYLGITHLKHRRRLRLDGKTPFILIALELLSGLSLIAGAYTQLGAMLLIGIAIYLLIVSKKWHKLYTPAPMTAFLLIGCGLTLFITGAGAFAFDLPI
jgi:uncharacterized membrane protein YphA (DoxX/SURF4 family)